jgi:hypothetical protein
MLSGPANPFGKIAGVVGYCFFNASKLDPAETLGYDLFSCEKLISTPRVRYWLILASIVDFKLYLRNSVEPFLNIPSSNWVPKDVYQLMMPLLPLNDKF